MSAMTGLTNEAAIELSEPKAPNPEDDKLVVDESTLIDEGMSQHGCISLLYFLFVFSIWIVQILVQCNTPAYILSLSNCKRNLPYLHRLPLYSTYQGNSSRSDFYFEDWHFIPNLGLCPSVPMPNKYLPHFSSKSPTRRLDASVGEEVEPLEVAEEEEEEEEESGRYLRASGGGGGGRGGSSGGSGRSSSTTRSKTTSRKSSSKSSGVPRSYYGNGVYYGNLGGAAAVSYLGCISFGRKAGTQTKDQNSLDIWAALDVANKDPNYNAGLGLGIVDSDFVGAARGMLGVDSIMVLGTVLAGIGYPLTMFVICACSEMSCSETMIFLEALVQLITAAIAVAVINYLPDNGFVNKDSTTKYFQKALFPTCTVTIKDGPLFTMYLYIVIVSGMLFTIFLLAELRFHCCLTHMRHKRPEERSDYVAPVVVVAAAGKLKPFCGKCSSKLVKLEVDPYLAIGQYGICDGCNAEHFYRRDARGYHCCVCPIANNYDLCAACVDEHYGEEPGDDEAGAHDCDCGKKFSSDESRDQHARAKGHMSFAVKTTTVEPSAPPVAVPIRAGHAVAQGHKAAGMALVARLQKMRAGGSEAVPTSEPVADAPPVQHFDQPSTAQGVPMHRS